MAWVLRILLILLPIALGVYWLRLRQNYAGDVDALRSRERKLALIGGATIAAMFAALLMLGPGSGAKPGMVYVPPRYEDGALIDGEWLTPEEHAARFGVSDGENAPKSGVKTFGDDQ